MQQPATYDRGIPPFPWRLFLLNSIGVVGGLIAILYVARTDVKNGIDVVEVVANVAVLLSVITTIVTMFAYRRFSNGMPRISAALRLVVTVGLSCFALSAHWGILWQSRWFLGWPVAAGIVAVIIFAIGLVLAPETASDSK